MGGGRPVGRRRGRRGLRRRWGGARRGVLRCLIWCRGGLLGVVLGGRRSVLGLQLGLGPVAGRRLLVGLAGSGALGDRAWLDLGHSLWGRRLALCVGGGRRLF